MATFVEVFDVEKDCPTIVNIDLIVQIAPLVTGGCHLIYTDNARPIKVKENFDQFTQFAMKTVSADDIKSRIEKLKKVKDIAQVAAPPQTAVGDQ